MRGRKLLAGLGKESVGVLLAPRLKGARHMRRKEDRIPGQASHLQRRSCLTERGDALEAQCAMHGLGYVGGDMAGASGRVMLALPCMMENAALHLYSLLQPQHQLEKERVVPNLKSSVGRPSGPEALPQTMLLMVFSRWHLEGSSPTSRQKASSPDVA